MTVLLAQGELIRTRLAHAVAVLDLAVSATNLERQLAGRVPEFLVAPTATQPTSAPAEGQRTQATPGSDAIVSETQPEPAASAAEPQRESQ